MPSGEGFSKFVLVALIATPLAGILLLFWFFRPLAPSRTPEVLAPVAVPVQAPSAAVMDYSDADEDAVLEVEDMLLDLAQQAVRRSWGGVMYHVSPDFQGSPLLREADGPSRTVGGVAITTGGPDPRKLDRAGFRAALEDVRLRAMKFKVPSAKLEGQTLRARLRIDARGGDAWQAKRWVAEAEAELEKLDGRWQIRRFQGTKVSVEAGEVRFLDVTAGLGMELAPAEDPQASSRQTFGRPFVGGIAAGDFDGDGDTDVYVPRIGADAFFRNEGGRMVESGAALGILNPSTGSSALFLDYDNDGDLDLLVSNFEPARLPDLTPQRTLHANPAGALALYRNDGGKFVEVTGAAGLRTNGPAMSVCAADVDRDGDLDVYVCMYYDDAAEDPALAEEIPAEVFSARGGVPNQLWINRGDGTFRDEAAARGVADDGWSLAASFADYDGDGDPDLYLANDYGENRLFRNRGDGRFEDVSVPARAEDTGFGMGVTWLDFDGDGRLDLYVSNMYSTAGNRVLGRGPAKLGAETHGKLLKMARGNTLLRNQGDGTFKDVTPEQGVARAGWAWSSAAFDYDNDALPDLYVVNGFRTSAFATSDL